MIETKFFNKKISFLNFKILETFFNYFIILFHIITIFLSPSYVSYFFTRKLNVSKVAKCGKQHRIIFFLSLNETGFN